MASKVANLKSDPLVEWEDVRNFFPRLYRQGCQPLMGFYRGDCALVLVPGNRDNHCALKEDGSCFFSGAEESRVSVICDDVQDNVVDVTNYDLHTSEAL